MILTNEEIKNLYNLGIKDILELLDIIEVLNNEKNVARITIFNKRNINKIIEIINKNKDIFNIKKIINKKIFDIETQGFKKYNKEIKINETLHLYISKNKIDLLKAFKIDIEKPNSEEFGLFLSYPKCCITSFQENKKLGNHIFTTFIKNSIDNDFKYTNIDLDVLNYVPCSFNCEETVIKTLLKKEKIKYIFKILNIKINLNKKYCYKINKKNFYFEKILINKDFINDDENHYIFLN